MRRQSKHHLVIPDQLVLVHQTFPEHHREAVDGLSGLYGLFICPSPGVNMVLGEEVPLAPIGLLSGD